MDREKVRALLEEVAAGALAPEQALARLRTLPYEDLRFARVDLHRSLRHGVPEAVYCAGKTPEQVVAIVERLAQHHDNVLATHRVAESAAERDLRLVFASSSSVYGDALAYPTREEAQPAPVSPYGVTKLTCEHLLRAHSRNFGLDYVALRYFTVYGPRQRPDMAFARIVDALVEGTPFEVYGDGRQSRDFTFVGDAVAATVLAMRKGASGNIYNVGGGSEATLRESVEIMEELSGRTLDVRYGKEAAGDVRRTLADTGRIRGEIGWEPAVELQAGLASMLEATGAIVPAGRDND